MTTEKYQKGEQLMNQLEGSPGWKFLIEELNNADIKTLENKLMFGEYKDMNERNRDSDNLKNLQMLKSFPTTFIQNMKPIQKDTDRQVY